MIVVLEHGTTEAQLREHLAALTALGLEARPLSCGDRPLLHVVDGPTRRTKALLRRPGVDALVPTSGPRVRRQGRHFFPYHCINFLTASLLVLGLLVVLAGFFPPGVGRPVVHHVDGRGLSAPWFARPFVELVERYSFGWVVLLALAAVVFLVPLLDRTRGRGLVARLPFVLLGFALVAGWILLSFPGAS